MGVPFFGWAAKKLFGTRNQRQVGRFLDKVNSVNEREDAARRLTDSELRAKTIEFRKRIAEGEDGYGLIPEIFAIAREAMDRAVGIRNIFNPESGFDPDTLPEDARRLFDETLATMNATEAAPPEGDLLGSEAPIPAWLFIDIPNRIYEAVRELHPMSRPPFRACKLRTHAGSPRQEAPGRGEARPRGPRTLRQSPETSNPTTNR